MKTISEQIAGRCKHFTGAGNIICAAGVNYDEVKIKDSSPYKFPCIKGSPFSGGSCAKLEFKTPKEVEDELMEMESMTLYSAKAYADIKEKIKTTGEKQGFIDCPKCSGKLKYTAASSNGHIWAKCKCGIAWME